MPVVDRIKRIFGRSHAYGCTSHWLPFVESPVSMSGSMGLLHESGEYRASPIPDEPQHQQRHRHDHDHTAPHHEIPHTNACKCGICARSRHQGPPPILVDEKQRPPQGAKPGFRHPQRRKALPVFPQNTAPQKHSRPAFVDPMPASTPARGKAGDKVGQDVPQRNLGQDLGLDTPERRSPPHATSTQPPGFDIDPYFIENAAKISTWRQSQAQYNERHPKASKEDPVSANPTVPQSAMLPIQGEHLSDDWETAPSSYDSGPYSSEEQGLVRRVHALLGAYEMRTDVIMTSYLDDKSPARAWTEVDIEEGQNDLTSKLIREGQHLLSNTHRLHQVLDTTHHCDDYITSCQPWHKKYLEILRKLERNLSITSSPFDSQESISPGNSGKPHKQYELDGSHVEMLKTCSLRFARWAAKIRKRQMTVELSLLRARTTWATCRLADAETDLLATDSRTLEKIRRAPEAGL